MRRQKFPPVSAVWWKKLRKTYIIIALITTCQVLCKFVTCTSSTVDFRQIIPVIPYAAINPPNQACLQLVYLLQPLTQLTRLPKSAHVQTEIPFCPIQSPATLPSDLHWRFGVVVIVQEGGQTLNDGAGTGDLLASWGDDRLAHDFSVSRRAGGILGLNAWLVHWIGKSERRCCLMFF